MVNGSDFKLKIIQPCGDRLRPYTRRNIRARQSSSSRNVNVIFLLKTLCAFPQDGTFDIRHTDNGLVRTHTLYTLYIYIQGVQSIMTKIREIRYNIAVNPVEKRIII